MKTPLTPTGEPFTVRRTPVYVGNLALFLKHEFPDARYALSEAYDATATRVYVEEVESEYGLHNVVFSIIARNPGESVVTTFNDAAGVHRNKLIRELEADGAFDDEVDELPADDKRGPGRTIHSDFELGAELIDRYGIKQRDVTAAMRTLADLFEPDRFANSLDPDAALRVGINRARKRIAEERANRARKTERK